MVQTTYNVTPPVAFRGMLAESFSQRQIDSYIAEGAINLGCAVEPGTDPQTQVIPLATLANLSGISVGFTGIEKVAGSDAQIADKAQLPVMHQGRLWVIAGGDVTKNAEVIPSTGATTTFTAGTGTSTIIKCFARSAAANGELLLIEVVPYTRPLTGT